MSIGTWLYHRKRSKFFVFPLLMPRRTKQILAITYEREWELPEGYRARYYDINSKLKIISRPDIVIEKEYNDGKANYESLYKFGLKRSSPKAFWFIDAHLASNERMRYCDNFDFVFVAQSPYIEKVKQNTACKNVFWLPLCYPESAHKIHENNELVKYPISFIGRYGDGFGGRNAMISFLRREYGSDFFVTTDYENPKALVRASKLSVNYSIRDDLNFRVFQTLAYGSQLVTNYVPDIDKIEGLRERLYCFNDLKELKTIIDPVLKQDVRLHNLVDNQNWIAKYHTLKSRIGEMLEMMNTGKQVEYK
jgi:glycosyl transferase family 1